MRRRAIGYIEAVMAAAVMGIALAAGLTTYGAFAQGVAASPASGKVHLPFDSTRRAHAPQAACGFSLAEVIIVMVIMAILSAIAIPRFTAAAQNGTADLVARRLAADLRLAQAQAIQSQQQ